MVSRGRDRDKAQHTKFVSLAHELGCDPDDPRIKDVLKGMAAQGPKPHASEQKREPKKKQKKG